MKPLLSIVSPVYLGAPFIDELVRRVKEAAEAVAMEYEIILVNDGSPDNSWEIIERICAQDEKVIGLNLSRNFGQHYAITAGLVHTRGEWIIVMDCDLQDRPEEIKRLVKKAQEGYDLVLARRSQRRDGFIKRLFSRWFYRSLSWLTGIPYDHGVANFGIYRRKVIDAILNMGDSIRYFPTMVVWVGFKKETIDVQHDRPAGWKVGIQFQEASTPGNGYNTILFRQAHSPGHKGRPAHFNTCIPGHTLHADQRFLWQDRGARLCFHDHFYLVFLRTYHCIYGSCGIVCE